MQLPAVYNSSFLSWFSTSVSL